MKPLFASLLLLIAGAALRGQNCKPCGPDCYKRNLASNEFSWGAVLSDNPLKSWTNSGKLSPGPWYIDVNHADTNLLIGPLVIWAQSYRDRYPNVFHGGVGIPGCMDLRRKTLNISVKFHYEVPPTEFDVRQAWSPQPARLVFWFQTEIANRTVNYFYNQSFLDEALNDKPIPRIHFYDSEKWVCLGGNRTFATGEHYGCARNQEELDQALSSVTEDMGVLLLLPDYDSKGVHLKWLNGGAPARTPFSYGTRSAFELTQFSIE